MGETEDSALDAMVYVWCCAVEEGCSRRRMLKFLVGMDGSFAIETSRNSGRHNLVGPCETPVATPVVGH